MNYSIPLILLLSFLSACASGPPRPEPQTAPAHPSESVSQVPAHVPLANRQGRQIVAQARRQLGIPYRYGGANPRGFDCSGLVHYTHRQVGFKVPRNTQRQYHAARTVSLRALQPGDLLFFKIDDSKPSHVGIYEGNGVFIHAPSSGKRVSRARLSNPYWRVRLLKAGRLY